MVAVVIIHNNRLIFDYYVTKWLRFNNPKQHHLLFQTTKNAQNQGITISSFQNHFIMEKKKFNTTMEMANWINSNIPDFLEQEILMLQGINNKKLFGMYVISFSKLE